MEYYIQQVKRFKQQRNHIEQQRVNFENEYIKEPNQRELIENNYDSVPNELYDSVPNELYIFADEIDDSRIQNYYKKNVWTTFGNNYRESDMYSDNYDCNSNENYDTDDCNSDDCNSDDSDTNDSDYNENKLQYDESAEKNLQMAHKLCIDKILELQIEIIDTVLYPSNFHNRSMTCLGGGCTTFIFECKKNHYNFTIEFDDDCDCEPGILMVEEVLNTKTNEVYSINCDLFCQNTCDTILQNFRCLLECDNIDQYINQRYGIFINLEKLLNNNNLKCKHLYDDFLPKKNITLNDYDYKFVYEVETEYTKCYILPIMRDDYDYIINIIPYSDKKKLDALEPNPSKYSVTFNYKNENQIDKLVELIKMYTKIISNKFGYFENNNYYNHNNLNEIVNKYYKSYGNDFHMKYDLRTYFNYNQQSDLEIDVLFEITNKISTYVEKESTVSLENYILTKNFNPNGIYPRDVYYITVKYNPKKDKDNCVMTIDGLWYDINYDFKQDFYKMPHRNYFKDKKNIINNLQQISLTDTFSNIYKIINNFVSLCLD